ncbi:helix-turn-helix transcriptional regulator [Luteolibacter pohnpeiensis]|uniref:Helix-turn-helix transcriptional regulator n=1 Tax=Luteolibacter pohnpeiensis TaxID=454153 RepID=A0A934SDU4_9BACT|nr:AraC family transcriptional regulator [Luteolibacter pohnpeiensis]MBK1884049.1 helix-turn-helix transcriptional regulator [Luteolibacter pohnpeiensis]
MEFSALGGPMDEGQILIHEVGYLEENDWWIFPNTVSPFWRFYYNFDPGHHVVFRSHTIPLEPANMVLIPDHQVFDSRGMGKVRHFWVNFSLDLALKKGDSVILPIRQHELDWVTAISKIIIGNDPRKHFNVLHQTSALLHSVFTRPEIPWNDHPRSPNALKIAAYIAKHYAEPLEVSRLAQTVGISARTLSDLFQREYHMSVPRFIARVRIREAARMLENTNLSIEEIAERTGFPNRYYLTRVFTKITGKPPARYRKDSLPGNRSDADSH